MENVEDDTQNLSGPQLYYYYFVLTSLHFDTKIISTVCRYQKCIHLKMHKINLRQVTYVLCVLKNKIKLGGLLSLKLITYWVIQILH